MTLLLGIYDIILFVLFAGNLQKQADQRLLTLAQTAVPTLEIVKTRGRSRLNKNLPWRHLFSHQQQSLEWFSPNGQLLAREGTNFPQFPLFKTLTKENLGQGYPLFQEQGQVRSVTIAVYADNLDEKTLVLAGYLRASQSTEPLKTTLSQLALGLALGGIIFLIVISLSTMYLVRVALAPIKQSFQQLRQFTAEASHELRNPLTRIAIASEVMLNHGEKFQPSDARKIEMVNTAAKHMQHLVEDLLFLARTDAGMLAPSREGVPIPLDELLRTLLLHFDSMASAKNITLAADLTTGPEVKGDPSQLHRLFSNLLDNAIKYTEIGGRVSLSLRESRGLAVVTVADSGIGIPAEYLPFVFQRFWRSQQRKTQQEQGLGLGLAIAQTIVEQHGGKISVSSQVGVGTRFQVCLPI